MKKEVGLPVTGAVMVVEWVEWRTSDDFSAFSVQLTHLYLTRQRGKDYRASLEILMRRISLSHPLDRCQPLHASLCGQKECLFRWKLQISWLRGQFWTSSLLLVVRVLRQYLLIHSILELAPLM